MNARYRRGKIVAGTGLTGPLRLADSAIALLLASPGAGHHAISVPEVLGISIGAIIVIGLSVMLVRWLCHVFPRPREKVAAAILISICIGIAAEIIGYINENKAFYIAGSILFGLPLLIGIIMYNLSKI